jgi:3-hydroxyisobutyrate dehydrogenase-like beta-hydroxyacid dehydrogenase
MMKTSVTVLGLGVMGSALANTLIREGHVVTVWNRSEEKTASFRGRAHVARTVEEAVDASDLILVCVRDYDTSDELLHEPAVTTALGGKTLIQFSTGTAQRARDAGRWAREHTISYLDCTMHGGPRQIGAGVGTFHYTGDRVVFDAVYDTIAPLIGETVYLSEDLGYAAALDFARLGTYTGLVTVLASVFALMEAQGVRVEDYLESVPYIDRAFLEDFFQVWAAREYPSGNASLEVWRAWAAQWVQSGLDSSLDLKVPELVRDAFARAQGRGFGTHDVYALLEAFQPRSNNE